MIVRRHKRQKDRANGVDKLVYIYWLGRCSLTQEMKISTLSMLKTQFGRYKNTKKTWMKKMQRSSCIWVLIRIERIQLTRSIGVPVFIADDPQQYNLAQSLYFWWEFSWQQHQGQRMHLHIQSYLEQLEKPGSWYIVSHARKQWNREWRMSTTGQG